MARLLIGLLAVLAIGLSILRIEAGYHGLRVIEETWDGTPVTILHPDAAMPAPAVIIAHGFAGSRQLMEPFAVTLARNGYVAVSLDFQGHGRNAKPLAGDITTEDGATLSLVNELRKVIARARALPMTTDDVAMLGHSMASDIVVRVAVADPNIRATVAVSMFSEEVTATAPRNLLVIVGEYENFLASEALKAVALSTERSVVEAVTYGRHTDGTARRAVLANGTEHVTVLYSGEALAEATAWLDTVFQRTGTGYVERRGPWIGLLILGVVALGWALARLLPHIGSASPPLSSRRFLLLCAAPAVLTPLLLWPVPTRFLPVLVADYLALHFALYGALTLIGLRALGAIHVGWPSAKFVCATLGTTLFVVLAIGLPLDAYVAAFLPGSNRLALIVVLGIGTSCYTLADAWLTCRPGGRWWWYPFSKLCICLSLAAAIALDLEGLFFLIIIFPVIVLFFVIYGLFSRWVFRATRAPAVAGISLGVAFAWALAVTFPLLTG